MYPYPPCTWSSLLVTSDAVRPANSLVMEAYKLRLCPESANHAV